MVIAPKNAIRSAVTLLLIVCASLFATSPKLYGGAFTSATFAFAMASCLIFHLRIRPSWRDFLLVVLTAILLAGIDLGVLHYAAKPMAILSVLGIASFLVMSMSVVWAEPKERKPLLWVFVPALLFMITGFLIPPCLSWTAKLRPRTLDLYLFSFDGSLRAQPSFIVGQWFSRWPWLFATGLLFYLAIPIPLAVVYVGRLVRFQERAFSAMLAFLIASPIGMLFYVLFPACGPRYLLPGDFPWHPLPSAYAARVLLEPVAIDGPRNAMPSLHLACALLAWWYSRGLSWWERAIAFMFVAFTVSATLGLGEHWFADLVVAFPFAVLIQAISDYPKSWINRERLAAAGFGLGGVLAWLAALRYGAKFFWASPVFPWALAAATIMWASLRRRKLDPAETENDVASQSAHGEGVSVPAPQIIRSVR